MQLFIITIFIVSTVGVIITYPGLIFATHEENNSEDKKSGKQSIPNNDQTAPTDDNKQSTTNQIPILPPITSIPTIAASQTCSDASDKNNDKICAAETNPKQTVSQPQSTPTPQAIPKSDITISSNPSTTTPTNIENNMNDNGQSQSSGGSTSSSSSTSNDDQTDTSDEEQQHLKLGDDTRLILMQDGPDVSMFKIQSKENGLHTNIMPDLIRPIKTFSDTASALQWLSNYDDGQK